MFAHKYKAKMTKCKDKPHPLGIFRYCPVCGSPNFVTNNEKSKRCADCGFVYFFNPSGATVAVIVNERDELLVVRRAKEPAKGTLDLPGGFLDCAETAEEGVHARYLRKLGLRWSSVTTCFPSPTFILIVGWMCIQWTFFSFAG